MPLRRYPITIICCLAAVVLVLAMPLSVTYGGLSIPSGKIFSVLIGHDLREFLGLEPVSKPLTKIILELRLPRMLLAVIVGAGLAIVGALLQTATRNDLADPFLFGLSSGAAAGAVFVITFTGDFLGIWTLPIAAFVGGMCSAITVLVLVTRAINTGPERLVLAGLAVSFLFTAITNYLVFAGDQRAAHSVVFWSLGGLGLARWETIGFAIAGLSILLSFCILKKHQLDALLAGDNTAQSLGVSPKRLRIEIFVVSALFFTSCSKNYTEDASWAKNTLEKMTLRQKISQMLVYRMNMRFLSNSNKNLNKVIELVSSDGIGGIHFWYGDVGTALTLLNKIQSLSKIPILIDADIENGLYQRFPEGTELPPFMGIAATGDSLLAYEAGKIVGKEGRSVGIHWNFAPVVDINNNPSALRYPRGNGVGADLPNIDEKNINHVAIIKSKAGIKRGDHFHKKTTQWMLMTKGSMEYWYKKLNTKNKPKKVSDVDLNELRNSTKIPKLCRDMHDLIKAHN